MTRHSSRDSHQPRSFDEISQSLNEFEMSDRLLLSDMRKYAGSCVVAYRGNVIVARHDLASVREWLLANKIPMATVAIRFINEDGAAER